MLSILIQLLKGKLFVFSHTIYLYSESPEIHIGSYTKEDNYNKHLPDSTSNFMALPKVILPKLPDTHCYTS